MQGILNLLQQSWPMLTGLFGVLVGTGAAGAVRFVQEGERGLKKRFGKVIRHKDKDRTPKVVKEGWCWLWPGIDKLVKTHVRDDTINLTNQAVTLKDGTVFILSAVIKFHVEDTPQAVYRILIQTEDARRSFADFGLTILRSIVAGKIWQEFIESVGQINQDLTLAMQERGEEWGAVIAEFHLTDSQPNAGTAALIQANASVSSRVAALQTAAKTLSITAEQMPAQLAAALIGIPLVTAIGEGSGRSMVRVVNTHTSREDEDTLFD